MSNLKIVLAVNQEGKLALPFSRRVLDLPRIENCAQLRNAVVRQRNNFIWFYTRRYHRIRFVTTERELDEVYRRYAIKKVQRPTKADIILLDSATLSTDDEEEDEDDDENVKWIRD